MTLRRVPRTDRDAALKSLLAMRPEREAHRMIRQAVAAGLPIEQAIVLVHHNVCGRTASEIVSLHPDVFASCDDMYRVAYLLLESAARLLRPDS